jgi:hypothetical protein
MIGFGVVSGIGRENVNNRLLMIILIGVTLYVLLFEVLSKYLYMYLPIYILLAVNAVAGYINKRGRRILLINQQGRRPLFASKSRFFFDFSGFWGRM